MQEETKQPGTVTLNVDGISTTADRGTPLLEVIRGLGINVPTLCHHPLVEPYGVCRLCTVEVVRGRRRRLVTSCNYPAQDGISVLTGSDRVLKGRRMIAELLLARCPDVKEVSEIARSLGVEKSRFPAADEKCVLCGLCVKVCRDVVGAGVLTFESRGPGRVVTTAYGGSSDRCIDCGACAQVCPTGHIRMVDESGLAVHHEELLLGPNKAIGIPFMQAVPAVPVIDRETCIHFKTGGCGVCSEACEKQAIDHKAQDTFVEIEVGSIVAATGFKPFDPAAMAQYGYGRLGNVMTALEFEQLNNASGPTGGKILMTDGQQPESVALIHCVGSRDKNHHEYCSRVCSMMALKYAHLIHEKTGASVYDFFIDLRCFGKGYEEFYNRLLEEGVFFIRGRAAEVSDFAIYEAERGKLVVRCEDTMIGILRRIPVDMVVLMTALTPAAGVESVARRLNLSRSKDGFFLEQHPKLAPVATPTDGVFIAGACQGPKDIPDSVAQASAAAAAAISLSVRGQVQIEPVTCKVDPERCAGCRLCNTLCPFTAITFDAGERVSSINDATCKGCGTCAAACPSSAIEARHFNDRQVLAEIEGVCA
ncbi:MAG: 4Fe-4S dicluster domain-containing protein [Deltaproteobacteria bacterium]|nr:4Fe-4S dicluster domain-containing protein [Deltaproteobacteria bacterium]